MTAAYLNHGRWVVDCACGGAERLYPDGQLRTRPDGPPFGLTAAGLFVCGSCGAEQRVMLPDDMGAIEHAVMLRPSGNRNWYPGETVDDLVAENLEHGLVVS